MRLGILLLNDPIVALDLSEHLAQTLHPISISVAKSADDVRERMAEAIVVVSDQLGRAALSTAAINLPIPHLVIGDDGVEQTNPNVAVVDEPFSSTAVSEALRKLGLVE